MSDCGNNNIIRVPSATSGIVVSNPVLRRIPVQPQKRKPEIKIVVTQQKPPETINNIRLVTVKSRKPRKEDLTRVIKEFTKTDPLEDKPQERFLILGGSSDKKDVSSLISDSFNIPKFVDSAKDGVVYVQCPECKKKLKQRSYRSHLRTHLGVKMFKCDLCNDCFTRKNDVKRHKKLIHEKPREHQCQKCEKYFLTQENLWDHEQKHLSDLKCREECVHGFGKQKYYEDHIKYVHPEGRGYIRVKPEVGEREDSPAEPAILRRNENRSSSSNTSDDTKKSKLPDIEDTPAIVVDEEETGLTRESRSESAPSTTEADTPDLGQLVQMPDGTFVIVNGETEEDAGSGEKEHGESQVRN